MKKFTLDIVPVLEHFKSTLEDTNALSSLLMRSIDFESGRFFTILPANTTAEDVYKFCYGGIARNIRDELPFILFEILREHTDFKCIIDDFNSTYTPGYDDPIFNECGVAFEDQVYYLLTQKGIPPKLINRCLQLSNAVWHSLGIVFRSELDGIKKTLTLDDIDNICSNAKLIIVGAYDGEGYVFWERTGSDLLSKLYSTQS